MKKLVAACVVVLLLVGGTWWTAGRMSRSEAASRSRDSAEAAIGAARKRKRTADSAPKGEIAPVELDRCDRDVDLFGRVIDEDGKPVAGASVETLSHPWRGIDMGSSARWYETEPGPATRTASDGTFAIRLARCEKLDLRVTADTFGAIVREDCQAGERVEITLRRGVALDVTTVDQAGAPVPGVRVKLHRDRRRFAPFRQESEGVTDAAGRLVLAGLLQGPVQIQYLHHTLGEPKYEYPVLPATGTLSLRVTMPAGRTVKGRVTDADTQMPIAGALVDSFNFTRPVTTGADGRYALPGWTHRAPILLAVKATGYVSVYRDVPDDGVVDVALQLGDRVVGRLVHADGTPVEDAYVGAYGSVAERGVTGRSARPSDADAARTSADGRFDLGGLSRDIPHTLIAVAPGLARKLVEFDRHFWTGARIDLGDVVMTASRSIEGVAVDLDGTPLADATVTLAEAGLDPDRPGRFVRQQSRRTDDLGRFRFPDLAAGKYEASVQAMNSPRGPLTRIELPSDRDVLDARVTLGGSKSITVLVIDDLGAPVDDVSVCSDCKIEANSDGLLSVPAGADGRATFRGLEAVPSMFSAIFRDGRHIARAGPFVPDGQEVRIVARRTIDVRGIVRGEDGRPLESSIKATLHGNATDAGSGWSDETGAFTVKVPLGEIVDLWARGTVPDAHGSKFTGFEGRRNGVTGPMDGVEIVLKPVRVVHDRTLVVIVQDSTGVPVPGVELGVYEPPKIWKVKTDADGRVRFEGLPNRSIVVNFAELQSLEPQHALDIAPLRVSAVPQGQELVVKYRAGAAIRGRVVDSRGRGVADACVQVTTRDATYIDARCDADGRFVAHGLPGLPHSLTAQGFVDGEPLVGTIDKVVPGDAEVTITVATPDRPAR